MARAAQKNDTVYTDLRMAKKTSTPVNPATGTVRLYIRKPGADTLLIARLANGVEVTVATLVSGGALP